MADSPARFSFISVLEVATGVIIALLIIGLFGMAKKEFEKEEYEEDGNE